MNVSELLDAAIEEIGRVLIGNKDRHTEEVYLKNAIRHIREYGSQPQLTDDQQIVLDYLKEITIEDVSPMRAMEFLKYELKPNEYGGFQASAVGEAFYKLDNKEEAQVLKVFSQWALEQEEE